MIKLIICCFLLFSCSSNAQENSARMQQLFNGKNLNGWYSYLPSKGKNNDPEKVFAVDNGILHISGKEFGYICTEKVYTNFILAVEFKWGEKKYPPRDADTTRRDNGILYFVPADATDRVWPKGIECQIQEGDTGDFWMVDSATLVADGVRSVPKDYNRFKKKLDAENPTGEWNRVVVITDHGKITHIVNNKKVNEGTDPSISGGKIIIQSEGAEIFYRKIEITVLK